MSQQTQESIQPQPADLKLIQELLKEANLRLPIETFREANNYFSGGPGRQVILYYLALAVENKLKLSFMPENLNKAILQDAYQRGRMDLASELLNLAAIVAAQKSE